MRFSLRDSEHDGAARVALDSPAGAVEAQAVIIAAAPPPPHETAGIDSEFVRGGSGPNGKVSLTVTLAGAQISRGDFTLNGQGAGHLGQAASVSYAFRSTLNPGGEATFSRVTADEMAAIDMALGAWADVANLTFTRQGTGTSGEAAYSDNATILFANYNIVGAPAAAYAFFPGSTASSSVDSDVWINRAYIGDGYWNVLSYGVQVLVHELGHALGLSHPGDYAAGNGSPTYATDAEYFEDSRQYAVMSYWSETETGADFNYHYAAAPLMDDIAAIQRLYGANLTARTGNTVYGFNSNAGKPWFAANAAADLVIFCVWDAGGTDLFDFSGYVQDALIDLRATHFSSVGGLTGNVSIAQGVTIEDATGGTGNDLMIGNAAANRLEGGAGNDTLMGGDGVDTAVYSHATAGVTVALKAGGQDVGGGQGSDELTDIENLTGSGFDDSLSGNSGNNTLDGGAGMDMAGFGAATSGVSVSLAIAGAQSVGGGQGTDTLVSIEGLLGSGFNDTLTGNGSDNLFEGGAGDDTIDGAGGSDTIRFTFATGAVTVNLSLGTAQAIGGGQGSDTLISIENVLGSGFNDSLTGNGSANVLDGGPGNDLLDGAGGSDTVSYRSATGGVQVNLGVVGAQAVGGGQGSDSLVSIENLTGSAFDDLLAGSSGDNAIDGGAGFDTLTFAGVAGNVTVSLALTGGQAVAVGQGTDTYAGFEAIIGSGGNDSLTGDGGDNQLTGGLGNDSLTGGAGVDTAVYSDAVGPVTVNLATGLSSGALGFDTLSQVENVIGSVFDDSLTGDGGDNLFDGGLGNDSIAGGGGLDTVSYAAASAGIAVDLGLATSQAIGGGQGSDTLTGIEGVIGSAFSDNLYGTGSTLRMSGGAGDDTLTIRGTLGAAARIDGGDGQNSLWLDGDYASGLVLGATTVTHIHDLYVVDGHSYSLTLNAATVAASDELVVHGDALASGFNFTFNAGATAAGIKVFAAVGHDVITSGSGNDNLYFYDRLQAGDSVDAGDGYDWMYLWGNYSLTFSGTTMRNVEGLVIQGDKANTLVMADGNVAAGQSLYVYGAWLTAAGSLNFDGRAETDGSFSILGGAGVDSLRGGRGDDSLTGGAGNDIFRFNVNGGNDTILDFVAGDKIDVSGADGFSAYQSLVQSGGDVLITFAANTTLRISNSTVAAVSAALTLASSGTDGTSGPDLMNGTVGNDVLNGLAGNDTLNGLDGNDALNGGSGIDAMTGGKGNDTYTVDNAGDTVVELAGQGTDVVNALINYTLTANVERLVLTGTANIAGTGNADVNQITGNTGNNKLDGGAGADTLIGGAGNDTYFVDDINDKAAEAANEGLDQVTSSVTITLASNVENLLLTGSAAINGTGNGLNNVIWGNDGGNRLDGGAGVDKLLGGLGDDTYVIDNASDKAEDVAGGGVDIVLASNSHILSQYVENLTLTGSLNITATGNDLDNILIGNAGNNRLTGGLGADAMTGGAGHDTYYVDNVGDTATEGLNAGVDLVQAYVSFSLSDNVENLYLNGSGNLNGTGNAINNLITGTAGNNVLDGQGGVDKLFGGLGDDTYYLDNASDSAKDEINGGTDLVYSSASWVMTAYIENMTLTGSANITGTGNALANVLIGNAGNNKLDGWTGNDMLTGGLGNDTFVFGASSGVDTITDFTTADYINTKAYSGGTAFGGGITVTQVGGDVLINLGGGNTVTVFSALRADVVSHMLW